MKKYIYKITNIINGKSYIGQTDNYKKRWNAHIRNYGKSVIGFAIQKYGVDNFTFDVLDYTEDYNNIEIKLIKEFDTYRKGYNLTMGGESGSFEKYDIDEIRKVIEMIRDGILQTEIMKITGHSIGFLVNLNYGRIYKLLDYSYPLSPNSSNFLDKEEVFFIEDFIFENQNLTLKEIAMKTGRSKTTIESIHKGTHKYSSDRLFPLKKKGTKISALEVAFIENLLSTTIEPYSLIISKTLRSEDSIVAINQGRHIFSNKQLIFPIR